MSVPKFDEMMKPILDFMGDEKEHRNSEVHQYIVDRMDLSVEDLDEDLPSGKQKAYKNRANWALTYLSKAGLLNKKSRGIFRISELGIHILRENPNYIDKDYLMKYDSFRVFMGEDSADEEKIADDNDPTDDTPEVIIGNAIKLMNRSLADDLMVEIMQQSPDFFEALVVKLLAAMGYGQESAQVVGKSGDDGVDGILQSDKLGLDEIYVQAKHWSREHTVGNKEIRDFSGALTLHGASRGVFITTSSFSSQAIKTIEGIKTQKIIAIDGRKLTDLMIEYNVGVSVAETYVKKVVDNNFFSED